MASIRNFLRFADQLPGENAIVVGAWEPQIAVLAPNLRQGKNHYLYLMTAGEVEASKMEGRPIYYLPEIRGFNYRVTGVDLAQCGGNDLYALYQSGLSAQGGP